MQSILAQTLTHWELIIVDSQSDDGSWEYLEECARADKRMRATQAPRDGIYASWNRCIKMARGEYIYLATSDDTMTTDCLEKMVLALVGHPDCGLAICCLRTIDENGDEIEGTWESWGGNRFLGDRLKTSHTRYPPYDAIVGCAWDTTYISITQVLVRRAALDRIGLFRTDFGTWGDYEWNIRNALLTPRVHVPEFLATWRRTSAQATQDTMFSTSAWHMQAVDMLRSAYLAAGKVDPRAIGRVSLAEFLLPERQEVVRALLRECRSLLQLSRTVPRLLVEFPRETLTYIAKIIGGRRIIFGLGPEQVQRLLTQAAVAPE